MANPQDEYLKAIHTTLADILAVMTTMSEYLRAIYDNIPHNPPAKKIPRG